MTVQTPCWNDPAAGAWLESMFGHDRAPGYSAIVRDVDGESIFARTGGPAVLCWAYANEVRAQIGTDKVQLAGFWCSDNPGTRIEEVCDGHDFAIVADRWIVDGWIKLVEPLSTRIVFDLKDPADALPIKALYGDPTLWKIRDE